MSYKTDSSVIINQGTKEKYTWAEGCFGWHYLHTKNLSIIREEMAPNTSETAHHHNFSQQFFYILKGLAVFNIDDQIVMARAGEGIHITPKKRHSIMNNSNENLEFLVISEPHSDNDRIQ